MKLSKPQKLIVVLSIIWTIISLLISADSANSAYTGFNFISFISVLLILTLPFSIYWAGVWIWGFGYLRKTGKKTWTGLQIVISLIIALIFFGMADQAIVFILPRLGAYGLNSFGMEISKNVIANLKATANILGLICGFLVGLKSYKWLMKSKKVPDNELQ